MYVPILNSSIAYKLTMTKCVNYRQHQLGIIKKNIYISNIYISNIVKKMTRRYLARRYLARIVVSDKLYEY